MVGHESGPVGEQRCTPRRGGGGVWHILPLTLGARKDSRDWWSCLLAEMGEYPRQAGLRPNREHNDHMRAAAGSANPSPKDALAAAIDSPASRAPRRSIPATRRNGGATLAALPHHDGAANAKPASVPSLVLSSAKRSLR